ncbi:hypothetical protein [Streptomyces anulatus]|uniref:hypothetical protein n=1 Tax=Streptomyces anulatus TaxID=1892 RepID=UPI00365D1DB6
MRDTPANTILTVLLREYGYTHRSLADEVNRISGRVFGRPGAATERDVRCWISGAVRWPTGRCLLPLAEIFDRPPEAMGFVPRGHSSRLPAPPSSVRPGQEEPVKRRAFLTASTAATLTLALRIEETPVRGRLTMTDVDRITTTIGRLDAHFTAIGGGALLTVATTYIDRLRNTMDAARTDPVSNRPCTAHSAVCRLRLRRQRNLPAPPRRRPPVRNPREGRTRPGPRMVRPVGPFPRRRPAPRGIGHARLGDHSACARSLLAAEKAHDRFDTTTPPPPWLRFLDTAEIAGLAAIAHRATGRLPDAEKATAQALRLLGPSMHRNRAYYGIQLAQGDTTSARATAATVDTTAVSSPRIAQRLATVHRHLATAQETP